MRPTPARYNNQKLSKVILLSGNYKRHYDNLQQIKPAVDFSDNKHMKHTLQLSIEKDRYTRNVRKLRLTQLQKENQEIIRRINAASSPLKKAISPPHYTSRDTNKTLEHQNSRKSISSAASDKTCGSNFRRRTLRVKEIEVQNKKIAKRILHPKMAKQLNFSNFNKFYEEQQSHSRIRSRFSDRSQSIMQSIALDGLKLQKKNVQFLPQISMKRLCGSISRTQKGKSKPVISQTIQNSGTNPESK